MTALDQITQDLNWRESELGSLKVLMARKDISSPQREVLLRASWAMLYAHYEGFVRTALSIFFDEARKAAKDCGCLPLATRALAMAAVLKSIRSLPADKFLGEIDTFSTKHDASSPTFPDVDTKSNLWPNVLDELLNAADIKLVALENHRVKLNTLVSRRNGIAHGKSEFINELSYYIGFETAVYDLMYDLAYQIDERLNSSPYV